VKTATVMIHGPNGSKRAICLFDEGSHRTYIRTKLAQELGLSIVDKEDMDICAY
jgi:hypothetical protein